MNTTFIALNLIFNIASGFLVIGWTYYQNKIWFTFLIVFQYIWTALLLFTGIILFEAVRQIRSYFAKEEVKQDRINLRLIILHLVSFGIFLLSAVGYTLTSTLSFLPKVSDNLIVTS